MSNADATAVRLADFGAAFSYDGAMEGSGLTPALIERVEVRAFGVLVAEVAHRIRDDRGSSSTSLGDALSLHPNVAATLKTIAADCNSRDARERPSFHEVLGRIDALKM